MSIICSNISFHDLLSAGRLDLNLSLALNKRSCSTAFPAPPRHVSAHSGARRSRTPSLLAAVGPDMPVHTCLSWDVNSGRQVSSQIHPSTWPLLRAGCGDGQTSSQTQSDCLYLHFLLPCLTCPITPHPCHSPSPALSQPLQALAAALRSPHSLFLRRGTWVSWWMTG